MSERFAIYFTLPANDPVYKLASSWLGYDVHSPRDICANSDNMLTSNPARYGFHATLKPPFRLDAGCCLPQLEDALECFARRNTAFTCDGFEIRKIDGFLALVAESGNDRLNQLANSCVEYFDRFRAPLNDQEYARRQPDKLSCRQNNMLLQWGYPYLFDEYRFHMTLTNQLPNDQLAMVAGCLGSAFGDLLNRRFNIDRLYLFRQANERERFQVISQYQLQD